MVAHGVENRTGEGVARVEAAEIGEHEAVFVPVLVPAHVAHADRVDGRRSRRGCGLHVVDEAPFGRELPDVERFAVGEVVVGGGDKRVAGVLHGCQREVVPFALLRGLCRVGEELRDGGGVDGGHVPRRDRDEDVAQFLVRIERIHSLRVGLRDPHTVGNDHTGQGRSVVQGDASRERSRGGVLRPCGPGLAGREGQHGERCGVFSDEWYHFRFASRVLPPPEGALTRLISCMLTHCSRMPSR